MDEKIGGTVLTVKKLRELVQSIDSPDFPVNGHQLENVTGEVIGVGQGFTSKVIRVGLNWKDAPHLPKTIIAKVLGDPPKNGTLEINEVFLAALRQMHEIECKIYDLEGLKDAVPMPRCYAKTVCEHGEPGIIIMEDLTERNGVVMSSSSWGLGVTNGQLEEILGALANLHAWSVSNTNCRDSIKTLKECNPVGVTVEQFVNVFGESKKAFPDVFQKLDEKKVKEYINADRHAEVFDVDPKGNLPVVLVHGDVHMLNMVFEKESNNQPGAKLIALLDWQASHQSCQMEDVARVFLMCVSTERRRQEGDKILQRYVQLFNGKLNDPVNHVKFEDCKKALDDMFAYSAVLWNCIVPLLIVKEEYNVVLEAWKKGVRSIVQEVPLFFLSHLYCIEREWVGLSPKILCFKGTIKKHGTQQDYVSLGL